MVYQTLGSIICAVMFSGAPVTAVELAPSDADPDVARQTHRCKTSDLGEEESEVAGSSTGEAEHYQKDCHGVTACCGRVLADCVLSARLL